MKKVLLIVAALLLVGSAVFAADIAGDKLGLKATVSGSAKLIWGMSLDDSSATENGIQYATGFKNEVDATVKLTLIATQTVQANGGPGVVYAEIQIADVGMNLTSANTTDSLNAILAKVTAKLNIGPVYINILGDSHSTDMAMFGQKLVSGREDKRGIYLKMGTNDASADQKGSFKGLSIGLTDQRYVKLMVGVASNGIWKATAFTITDTMLANAPMVTITDADNPNSASGHKVPLGKIYYKIDTNQWAASATIYTFDQKPAAGIYAVLDADEVYSNKANVANASNVYDIFVSAGLGDEIAAATGITFDVKAVMSTYLEAADTTNTNWKNLQSGIGAALGYKLSTSGLIKNTSLQLGLGFDWKVTSNQNTLDSAAIAGWTGPSGRAYGNKDEIDIGAGIRFNLPGNAMNESNSAEFWGIPKSEKLNIYPGLAAGMEVYTGKNGATSGAWRPAYYSFGASFYDGALIPVVDVIVLWDMEWDSANHPNANAAHAAAWELGARVSATVDIFTPYVEFYKFQSAMGEDQLTNTAFVNPQAAFATPLTVWNTTLKVGVDITPFKLTTFGICYESGNLALTHAMYTVGGANAFWGNLQLSVKIAL